MLKIIGFEQCAFKYPAKNAPKKKKKKKKEKKRVKHKNGEIESRQIRSFRSWTRNYMKYNE